MNYYSWHYGLDGDAVSLEQHDKRFHPNGYNAEASCKFRDQHPELVQQQRRSDNADNLTELSNVSQDDDKKYEDAVRNGDKGTALQMIRTLAEKHMAMTCIKDADGAPTVVAHCGTFGVDNFIPNIGRDGMHFGTEQAAQDRKRDKFSEMLRSKWSVGAFRGKNGKWQYVVNHFEPDEYNSEDSGSDGWDTPEEAMRVGEESYQDVASNMTPEDMGFTVTNAFLNIKRPFSCRDQGVCWGSMVNYAKEHGYDGIVYENLFENSGSKSYVAFEPSQIKSAEITYDDNHQLIPLSKRFDFANPDIRY